MACGKTNQDKLDPLTAWELAAINLLLAVKPIADFDITASKENMLSLMESLDCGELDPALSDSGFIGKTEALLLAQLRGECITVSDPTTFAARREIFAAAQVIYHWAVAQDLWKMHPEIEKSINGDQ